MATVVKTIGSAGGRDYSTVAAFVAAVPANLVTDGNIWQGQCYNDSEFVISGAITISGHTTDSTHYIEITTGPGQSFQDSANVRTNLLAYSTANGVGINNTTVYGTAIFVTGDNYTRINKLQLKTADHTEIQGITGLPTNLMFKDLLCDATGNGSNQILSCWTSALYINVTAFIRNQNTGGLLIQNGSTAIGCSMIKTTSVTAGGNGYKSIYSSNKLQSCTSFGFTTVAAGTAWDTTNSKNNGTEQASGFPGTTANQYNITYSATSPFTQASTTNTDLRTVSGTNLSANGFLDSTNAPNDISATARASSPTIGHWELVAAASSGGILNTNTKRRVFPGMASFLFFFLTKLLHAR